MGTVHFACDVADVELVTMRFSIERTLSRCWSRRVPSAVPTFILSAAMSACTASSTLFFRTLETSITRIVDVVPGGTKSAPKRRLNTAAGSYSGGFALSGPLCER